MAKQTLRAVTPVGTFTRATNTAYKFVTVWASPRCAEYVAAVNAGTAERYSGVHARWLKDNGYGVTWHSKRPDPRSFQWDSKAVLVGVFEVMAA